MRRRAEHCRTSDGSRSQVQKQPRDHLHRDVGPDVASQQMRDRARIALIGLLGFLALTAAGGGITLLAGVFTPPLEMLDGSIFSSYLVPGLALCVVVGGTAAWAVVLLWRRQTWSAFASLAAALAVIAFELVEMAVIGSPKGAPRTMQILYCGIGLAIAVLAIASRRSNGGANPRP